MSNTPAKISPFFLDFMQSVNLNNHDSIMLRSNADAPQATCLELDVRLYGTHPDLTYMIGLIDEKTATSHPSTGESVTRADKFKDILGLADDIRQVDDCYLGPFDEPAALNIISAADYSSARLDFEREIAVP